MFLKVGKPQELDQRLYLLEIQIPGEKSPIYKIGKASGTSAKKRLLQICGSIYDHYRITPSIRVLRDRKVDAAEVFKLETTLHRFFVHYKYDGPGFDGRSECFMIEKDVAVQAYEATISGVTPPFLYRHPDDMLPEWGGESRIEFPKEEVDE